MRPNESLKDDYVLFVVLHSHATLKGKQTYSSNSQRLRQSPFVVYYMRWQFVYAFVLDLDRLVAERENRGHNLSTHGTPTEPVAENNENY